MLFSSSSMRPPISSILEMMESLMAWKRDCICCRRPCTSSVNSCGSAAPASEALPPDAALVEALEVSDCNETPVSGECYRSYEVVMASRLTISQLSARQATGAHAGLQSLKHER
jgi:hypothetical protein